MSVLIYGATGVTGRMVAENLLQQGIEVILAGRSHVGLKVAAGELGCDFVVSDAESLSVVVPQGTEVIVNAAGPFEATVRGVAEASLANGAHYVDVSNEVTSIELLFGMAPRFERAGLAAVPSAAYGSVTTDGLAKMLVDEMPDAVRLELATSVGTRWQTPGVAASTEVVLAQGGLKLVDGQLDPEPMSPRPFAHPDGPDVWMAPIPLGELLITPVTTGIDTVTGGVIVPQPQSEEHEIGTADVESRAWAQAFREDGSSVWASLTTGEGYDLAVQVTAAAVRSLLSAPATPGVVTAVGQWGASFLTSLPNVQITTSWGATMPRPSHRDTIRRAALECFADKGFESTRVSDIAKRSGLSAAALYNHYPSVEDLGRELFLHYFNAYAEDLTGVARLNEPLSSLFEKVIDVTVSRFLDDPAGFTFAALRAPSFVNDIPATTRIPARTIADLVERGQANGEIREGDAMLQAAMFLAALLKAVHIQCPDKDSAAPSEESLRTVKAGCLGLLGIQGVTR